MVLWTVEVRHWSNVGSLKTNLFLEGLPFFDTAQHSDVAGACAQHREASAYLSLKFRKGPPHFETETQRKLSFAPRRAERNLSTLSPLKNELFSFCFYQA